MLLFGVSRGTHAVPTGIVAAEILPVILLQRLQGRVRGIEGDVLKPRLLRLTCLADELDGAIHIRDGGVEAFFGHGPFFAV